MKHVLLICLSFLAGCASLSDSRSRELDENQQMYLLSMAANPEFLLTDSLLFMESSFFFLMNQRWPDSLTEIEDLYPQMNKKQNVFKGSIEFKALPDGRLQMNMKQSDIIAGDVEREFILDKPEMIGSSQFLVKGNYTKPLEIPIRLKGNLTEQSAGDAQ